MSTSRNTKKLINIKEQVAVVAKHNCSIFWKDVPNICRLVRCHDMARAMNRDFIHCLECIGSICGEQLAEIEPNITKDNLEEVIHLHRILY